MNDYYFEIIGLKSLTLHKFDSARLEYPDVSNENEVNIIASGLNSYEISEIKSNLTWERTINYSQNYKQIYSDEITFLVHGIENQVPEIIQSIRNTRCGFLAEVSTISGQNWVFQSPFFMNRTNTKQVDSHSWLVSMSYKIPSFLDKLKVLSTILANNKTIIESNVEIIGIKELRLFENNNLRLFCHDLSNQDEVDIYTTGKNYLISEVISLPKWSRRIEYSANIKPVFRDEFSFQISGIENNIPEIINELKSNRYGFLAAVTTTGNKKYIFKTSVFINDEVTQNIDSNTFNVKLSYKVPTFDDKLSYLDIFSDLAPIELENNIETIGLKSIALYINDNVSLRRPDPSKENEVDIIAHAIGSYVISDVNENPKWQRKINNSGNFKQSFIDEFSFTLHGIENFIPQALSDLRNNRLGYIVEIITTGNESFIFPEPVFLNSNNTKRINSNSWNVSLSYRVPTFNDKLKKLNTVLMTNSYVLVDENTIMGFEGVAFVSN